MEAKEGLRPHLDPLPGEEEEHGGEEGSGGKEKLGVVGRGRNLKLLGEGQLSFCEKVKNRIFCF